MLKRSQLAEVFYQGHVDDHKMVEVRKYLTQEFSLLLNLIVAIDPELAEDLMSQASEQVTPEVLKKQKEHDASYKASFITKQMKLFNAVKSFEFLPEDDPIETAIDVFKVDGRVMVISLLDPSSDNETGNGIIMYPEPLVEEEGVIVSIQVKEEGEDLPHGVKYKVLMDKKELRGEEGDLLFDFYGTMIRSLEGGPNGASNLQSNK